MHCRAERYSSSTGFLITFLARVPGCFGLIIPVQINPMTINVPWGPMEKTSHCHRALSKRRLTAAKQPFN